MKFRLILVLALSTTLFFACKDKSKNKEGTTPETEVTAPETNEVPDAAHNSENSLDWNGTYEGTLPCADCPGIEIELTLNSDLTYSSTMEYLERDTTYEEQGKFEWDDSGSEITLYESGENESSHYKVGENQLIFLDSEGNQIEGNLKDAYILIKK